MFRPLSLSHGHRRPHRRGTSFILIVVIMTSIMAAVGVAYALFAIQVGRSSDLMKQGQGGGTSTPVQAPNPTNTINQFFGTLIYDVGDGDTYPSDVTNGIRGHSLAAAMYGRLFGSNPSAYAGVGQIPYAGVGTFHESSSGYAFGSTAYGLTGDRAMFVNHTVMTFNGVPFLLDPEWTGSRGTNATSTTLPTFATSQANRSYIGKHVGYSYPDLAHFYEAQVDPATGEVRVPSFHRPWLWNSGNSTLDPSNPNWYNAQGRLMTLRPRPQEHPQFPFVPPNADGTYTGDVQNLPGGSSLSNGSYGARNDSIWLNLGLPTVPMGKMTVQPLVAALIIPLNGRFNASVHGNTYGSQAHQSYAGWGPHEVNIAPGLAVPQTASSSQNANESDRQATIGINNAGTWTGRGPPAQRIGTSTRVFDNYNSTGAPNSAAVVWNNGAVTFPAYPTGNNIGGLPGYAAAGFQSGNISTTNHPSLFNPLEWLPGTPIATGSGNAQTYALGDLKRLSFRQAFTPAWYTQATLVGVAPNGLGATSGIGAYAFNYAPNQTTSNGYRLDPVNANRGLFTPRGYDLDRPKVVPNFVNRDAANGLSLNVTTTNGLTTMKPGGVSPGAYPSPQTLGPVTDFAASNQWVNLMAALGSVNLNRPLADYRNLSNAPNVNAMGVATPQPLSSSNMGNQAQADADRQQLARDIFVRLASAVGFGLVVTPTLGGGTTYTVSSNVTAGSSQYQALQYLAQLAVNIVDYIDNDDISTVFVWNPNSAVAGGVDFTSATDIDNRVVFGVERTRLVINEAYSEVTDDPTVQAPTVLNPVPTSANANVRFWLELLNPTSTPASGSIINDGSVPLSAYRIEIARANRSTVPMGTAATQTGNLAAYLTTPGNATGRFATVAGNTVTAVTPDIVYPLSASTVTVPPNNGTFAQTGIQLVGPQLTTTASTIEFNPGNAGVWANAVFAGAQSAAPGSPSMSYTIPIQTNGTFAGTEFKRNVVLLRRLANPYLPVTSSGDSTTNPYITVDMMDYVPSFDAVAYGSADTMMRPQFTAGNTGYDPFTSRFSVGKVQPYAGHANAVVTAGSGNYNDYTVSPTVAFPNTMVVNQKVAAPAASQPNTTFGQHNYSTAASPAGSTFTAANPTGMPATPAALSDTIMTPFDWMIHMDRPLINQMELFPVRDAPPYRVTDQFITTSTNAPGITYATGHASWKDIYAGVGRALEYLTVRPQTIGVPHGGRVPGRISLNDLQDQRVLQGLLDPQTANGFDSNYVKNVAWSQWLATRRAVDNPLRVLADGVTTISRAGAAGATSSDSPTATTPDQPFMSFGAPAADPSSAALPFAYGGGSVTDQWSILRRPAQTGPPYLYTNGTTNTGAGVSPPAYPASQPNGPAYYQAEPIRKILNNSTTVNQQYLVIMTIGYFQVTGTVNLGNGVSIPQLGAEAYVSIPGDARQQVIGLVDMSNMALDPINNTIATSTPFFTTLEQTARPGNNGTGQLSIACASSDANDLYVAADGQLVAISANSTLVLGYGTEQQVVTVSSVAGTKTLGNGQTVGLVNVTGMTRTAWGGSCVSNVRPGYPGPQPNFQYTSSTYTPVLPFIQRLN